MAPHLLKRFLLGTAAAPQVVRKGFTHPVDNLACHRLAVLQPGAAAGARDDAERADLVMDGSGGDLAGSPCLQVCSAPVKAAGAARCACCAPAAHGQPCWTAFGPARSAAPDLHA